MRRVCGPKIFVGIAGSVALIASIAAADGQLPLPAPVPGGVAVICVGRTTDPAPLAEFDGRRVLITRTGDGWHAVVGLPLALRPGAYELSVLSAETGARKIRFDVGSRDYDTQRLTLANQRQVDPEPADLLRINRELAGEFNPANFRHRAFYNQEQRRVEMHLVSLVRQRVRVCGKAIEFRRGETIHTENSYKYTVELFRSHASAAGWASLATWVDGANYFSVHALRAQGSGSRKS